MLFEQVLGQVESRLRRRISASSRSFSRLFRLLVSKVWKFVKVLSQNNKSISCNFLDTSIKGSSWFSVHDFFSVKVQVSMSFFMTKTECCYENWTRWMSIILNTTSTHETFDDSLCVFIVELDFCCEWPPLLLKSIAELTIFVDIRYCKVHFGYSPFSSKMRSNSPRLPAKVVRCQLNVTRIHNVSLLQCAKFFYDNK